MTAWQHPTDQCEACGQDILLWPEITPDARLTYVRYCPRCDAGEPVVEPRQRVQWNDTAADTESSWFAAGPSPQPVAATAASSRARYAATESPRARHDVPQRDLDLWWDGSDGGGRHRSDDLDAKWARFVASSDEDDDDMAASEGSFAFGGEDAPRRKRRFGLRRSA
jgi:hypothetical protein